MDAPARKSYRPCDDALAALRREIAEECLRELSEEIYARLIKPLVVEVTNGPNEVPALRP